MINKIFKRIHSKYLNFFKFFFFLRYVFSTFLIAICLFLLIPKLFDYEKRHESIKNYLLSDYGLEISNYKSITYKIFPLPNLVIKNIHFKFKNEPIFLKTEKVNIFLDFKSIYDYKNFTAKKILFNKNKINLDIDKTKNLLNYFRKLKSKFNIQDLNLDLRKQGNSIIEIKKVSYANYGYAKNKIRGEVFDRKFKAYLNENNKNLDFKILNTGISANFNFNNTNEKNLKSGSSKINILNNYLKLNFKIQNNQIEFFKSNLRNKYLLLSFKSLITLNPYFEINSDIIINKIDKRLIDSFNLKKIIKNQEILKKLNSKNKISFNKKKLRNSLIQKHYTELDLAHGRITFLSKINILGGIVNCTGDTLLIEEYPRLNFNCIFEIQDKKILLKKILKLKKFDNKPFDLLTVGSINLVNKKINFEKIEIKNQYVAKKEDLIFFKKTFEKLLLNEKFFHIFKENKIKDFFSEAI